MGSSKKLGIEDLPETIADLDFEFDVEGCLAVRNRCCPRVCGFRHYSIL